MTPPQRHRHHNDCFELPFEDSALRVQLNRSERARHARVLRELRADTLQGVRTCVADVVAEAREHGSFFRLGVDFVRDLLWPARMWPLVARGAATAETFAALETRELYADVRVYARALARLEGGWEVAVSFVSVRATRAPACWVPFACVAPRVQQALQALLLAGCFLRRETEPRAWRHQYCLHVSDCRVLNAALQRAMDGTLAWRGRTTQAAVRARRVVPTRDALDGAPLLADPGFLRPLRLAPPQNLLREKMS